MHACMYACSLVELILLELSDVESTQEGHKLSTQPIPRNNLLSVVFRNKICLLFQVPTILATKYNFYL